MFHILPYLHHIVIDIYIYIYTSHIYIYIYRIYCIYNYIIMYIYIYIYCNGYIQHHGGHCFPSAPRLGCLGLRLASKSGKSHGHSHDSTVPNDISTLLGWTMGYIWIINHLLNLVGAISPSWKMMEFVNGKDDIPYMKWKIKKCSKPPTSLRYFIRSLMIIRSSNLIRFRSLLKMVDNKNV